MNSHSKIGFALIGAGMIAEYHAQAIAANADKGAHLIAIGHNDQKLFSGIEEHFGVPCLPVEEMLDHPDVDVVCVCTPTGQHAAQTIQAAEAGKHVLVEKPMAITLADADAMIAACQDHHVTLGVAYQSRTKPIFREVYRAVQSGQLGELTLGLVNLPYYRPQSYFDQADWRGTWALDGGGALMNQGIHQVDLLAWYMGDPVEVRAFAHTLHRKIEVEDTLSASLRFANGSLAVINATTTAAPGFPPRIEIYGTHGGLQVEGDTPLRWMADGQDLISNVTGGLLGGNGPNPSSAAVSAGAGASPRGISAEGHTALVSDFIDSIQENRPPLITGVEGRRSLSIVLAVYQAAGLLASHKG